jgi:hypothetical protein
MPGIIQVWNIWPNVRSDYSEFEPYFQCLIELLGINEIPLETSTLERVFKNDDIPAGAWPEQSDLAVDLNKRRGAYIAFQKDSVTVIVHGFYKTPDKEIICWRAKAFYDEGRTIIDMPRKYVSRNKKHVWCERFLSCFLYDVAEMIQLAQVSKNIDEKK